MIRYSDKDIAALLAEPKVLPVDFRAQLILRDKRGHKERDLDIRGANGSQFKLITRQSSFNPLDFSIILAVFPAGSNQAFRLRRYNGKSHEHSNLIEGDLFYNFHIHMATARYQDRGTREDGYAEPTSRYADFSNALDCMLSDCSFDMSQDPRIVLL